MALNFPLPKPKREGFCLASSVTLLFLLSRASSLVCGGGVVAFILENQEDSESGGEPEALALRLGEEILGGLSEGWSLRD